jgi:hypothetical protein
VIDGDRDDITNAVLEEKTTSKSTKDFQFNPLFQTRVDNHNHSSKNTLELEPLFYYVAALPYHAIYCTGYFSLLMPYWL